VGFSDIGLDEVQEPMDFGDDGERADRFVSGLGFVGFMLRDVDEDTRRRAMEALPRIDARGTGHGVFFASAAWISRARLEGGR
jgi:hypothetical protein